VFLLLDSEELSVLFSDMACVLAAMMHILYNPDLQGELLKDILYDKVSHLSRILDSPFDQDVALLRTQAWEFSVQEKVLRLYAPQYADTYKQKYQEAMTALKNLDIPF